MTDRIYQDYYKQSISTLADHELRAQNAPKPASGLPAATATVGGTPPAAAAKAAVPPAASVPPTTAPTSASFPSAPLAAPLADATALLDTSLAALAAASRSGTLTIHEEAAAVKLALQSDARVLLTAKHFGGAPSFAAHVRSALLAAAITPTANGATITSTTTFTTTTAGAAVPSSGAAPPDVIVVGTGVAGMTTALRLLDRGAHVVLIDKETKVGGNSAKASSGINGCCPPHSRSERNSNDTVDAFAADTAKSAKRNADGLIGLLAAKSSETLTWLMERTAIDLSKVAQLGGHAHARTHRPANGMIGAELTFALHRELKAYVKSGALSLRTGCRLTGFVLSDEGAETATTSAAVLGVRYTVEATGEAVELRAAQTVLATGGFANDRTNTSLLVKHRPDLVAFPTTNGVWATGDGMKLAMAIGAGSIDMDRVQIHPTGFVDPTKPDDPTKVRVYLPQSPPIGWPSLAFSLAFSLALFPHLTPSILPLVLRGISSIIPLVPHGTPSSHTTLITPYRSSAAR